MKISAALVDGGNEVGVVGVAHDDNGAQLGYAKYRHLREEGLFFLILRRKELAPNLKIFG